MRSENISITVRHEQDCPMNIELFVSDVTGVYATGSATEHSYRPALKQLLSSIEDGVFAINEPKRVACGAPDFLVHRGEIAIGHVEAKDLGKNLQSLKGREAEQKQRYLTGLPNLIYTNCLDFEFYREGNLVREIQIAHLTEKIQANRDQFEVLENQLKDFAAQSPQTITSPLMLAEILAGKTALIRDVILNALQQDLDQDTDLAAQFGAFQEHLIEEITRQEFADLYAETVTYGLLAARLNDDSPEDFSRSEALELLPRSNPFLRSFFTYIAAADLDDRISWIIDDVAFALRATDADEIMARFGSMTGRQDPFIHFYETFLQKYNPGKRKSRGVWYTPEPVVNFIVRAVDEVLKQEFGLPLGLADTSKVTIDCKPDQYEPTKTPEGQSVTHATVKKEVHRVQLLDPATGTGTFLAEVIKQIAPRVKQLAEGIWSGYVEKDLLPRIHGFELLMASYAMCHLKLDRVLAEFGYQSSPSSPRLRVYLTDSLEGPKDTSQDLPFARWLSNEAREAGAIKQDLPIMCVIGNPPYSGESSNAGDWMDGLMNDYKMEPGGVHALAEKTAKWINNDYVKFIRLAQHFVESNGEGVVGFVTDHGYLDNPTFRGMRWQILRSFDKLYIFDLHGNTRKKEDVPDDVTDKNVFDIQQGVAVLVGVKRKHPTDHFQPGSVPIDENLAETSYGEIWGSRQEKYNALWSSRLDSETSRIFPRAPTFFFRPWDYEGEKRFNRGFGIDEFFMAFGNGIVTKRDRLCIQDSEAEVLTTLNDIEQLEEDEFRTKYELPKDVRDWRYEWARTDVLDNKKNARIVRIHYRPFDDRYVFYSGNSRGFVGWPVQRIMGHYIEEKKNIGLLAPKALTDKEFAHVFVASRPSEAIFLSGMTGSNAMNFPLYTAGSFGQTKRSNLDPELFHRLSSLVTRKGRSPTEIDAFDYVYGVLHCREYRSRNRAFLKKGFPRIPWPKSPTEFWDVAEKGTKLRQLHLMETNEVGEIRYPLLGQGDGVISEPRFAQGAVWINETQRFEAVPSVAWTFYIGGYQPAQKWLRDRKGSELRFVEILHYQQMIRVLVETDRIMESIQLTFDD